MSQKRVKKPYRGRYGDMRCLECKRLPVNSRRNTRCNSCGAIICERCQFIHFTDKHEG